MIAGPQGSKVLSGSKKQSWCRCFYIDEH